MGHMESVQPNLITHKEVCRRALYGLPEEEGGFVLVCFRALLDDKFRSPGHNSMLDKSYRSQ